MNSFAVVDAEPLVSSTDATDPDYALAVEALQTSGVDLVLPAMVLAEATYLVNKYLGPLAEARFLAGIRRMRIEAPTETDLVRMAQLVRVYADFPLGGTDASVVALAERLDTDLIITFDRRHFQAIRPLHAPAFRILP